MIMLWCQSGVFCNRLPLNVTSSIQSLCTVVNFSIAYVSEVKKSLSVCVYEFVLTSRMCEVCNWTCKFMKINSFFPSFAFAIIDLIDTHLWCKLAFNLFLLLFPFFSRNQPRLRQPDVRALRGQLCLLSGPARLLHQLWSPFSYAWAQMLLGLPQEHLRDGGLQVSTDCGERGRGI